MWECWCDPLRRQVIFEVQRLASGLNQPFLIGRLLGALPSWGKVTRK